MKFSIFGMEVTLQSPISVCTSLQKKYGTKYKLNKKIIQLIQKGRRLEAIEEYRLLNQNTDLIPLWEAKDDIVRISSILK